MMAVGKKAFIAALVIAVSVLSAVIAVTYAQTTIPTPSVPEFTLKYLDNSYDVKPTATVDPYTGANVTVQGYHVKQASIVLSIKNQPSLNNGSFSQYYNVRTKGHFEDNWQTKYFYYDLYNLEVLIPCDQVLPASDAEYTITSFDANYSANAQIDFQVHALLYNYSVAQVAPHPQYPEYGERENVSQLNLIAASNWSNTQTVTVPGPSPTQSPSESATPTQSTTITPPASLTSTLQPTAEPSSTPNIPAENLTSVAIVVGVIAVIPVAVGLLAYLAKYGGKRKMSKKAFKAAVAVSLLALSLVAGMPAVENATANPIIYPKPFPLYLWFDSPLNTTYFTNYLVLNFSILKIEDCNDTGRKAWYSIDGQEHTFISLEYKGITSNNGNALPHSIATGVAELPPLSCGRHNITVSAQYTYFWNYTYTQESSVTAVFSIIPNVSTPSASITPYNSPNSTVIIVPDDFAAVQDAINSANAGDIVFVKNGTYRTFATDGVLVNKPLSLIGESSQNTTLTRYAVEYARFAHNTVDVKSDNVTISGFTITGSTNGILLEGSGCMIVSNNINDNTGSGVYSSVLGKNNVIWGNNITNDGTGIYQSASGYLISNNSITRNNAWGIILDMCGNVTIMQNTILECGNPELQGYGGVLLRWDGPFVVYGNNITGNFGFGVGFGENCSGSMVYNNNIINNQLGVSVGSNSDESFVGTGNKVYYNNLIDNGRNVVVGSNFTDVIAWDNGYAGNYWSDYLAKYPNALELDSSGIWNTPYVIDANNADRFPEVRQVDTAAPAPTPTLIPSPSPTNSPAPPSTQPPTTKPGTTPNAPQANLTSTAVIVGVLIAVIVVIGLIAYLVKRRGRV